MFARALMLTLVFLPLFATFANQKSDASRPSPASRLERKEYTVEPENLERIENEARAKMTWGESPENVFAFLQLQGLSGPEATTTMESLKQERAANMRAEGIRKLAMGGAMAASPVIFYLVCSRMGYVPFKLLMLTVALGLWGIWKIIGGCINIFAPNFGNEDLSS